MKYLKIGEDRFSFFLRSDSISPTEIDILAEDLRRRGYDIVETTPTEKFFGVDEYGDLFSYSNLSFFPRPLTEAITFQEAMALLEWGCLETQGEDTTGKMSYRSSGELKKYLARKSEIHAENGKYVQGEYGDLENLDDPSCLVGQTVKDINAFTGKLYDPDTCTALAEALEIPISLAYLAEEIFEHLSPVESRAWAKRFLEALPVGVEYEKLVSLREGILSGVLAAVQSEFDIKCSSFELRYLLDRVSYQERYFPAKMAAEKLVQSLIKLQNSGKEKVCTKKRKTP